MTMTFGPHNRQGFGSEKLLAQPSTKITWWREAPDDFCDIPRQVHSLLKKGLKESVQDVCTTERSLTP